MVLLLGEEEKVRILIIITFPSFPKGVVAPQSGDGVVV
jgi:hypothetical protein